jgi:CheY-like chemotaxis protein
MPHRILLVDDDEFLLRLLAFHLHARGYETVQASNGLEALTLVEHAVPDLVITDWSMPVLDGLNLVSRLRADPACVDLPVIMLSGRAAYLAPNRDLDALRLRALLGKPFSPSELLDLVDSALATTPAAAGVSG